MIHRQHGSAVDRGADIAPETGEFWHALDQEGDLRDAYALIQERVQRYRDAGWRVPEQLRRRERDMMTELVAQSQGR